jgi:hypothetical protein
LRQLTIKAESFENVAAPKIPSDTGPSSFEINSKSVGRMALTPTRIRGARTASTAANHGALSNHPARNGSCFDKDSTEVKDAINETGIVQNRHKRTVNEKLMIVPTCSSLFDLPTLLHRTDSGSGASDTSIQNGVAL